MFDLKNVENYSKSSRVELINSTLEITHDKCSNKALINNRQNTSKTASQKNNMKKKYLHIFIIETLKICQINLKITPSIRKFASTISLKQRY